MDLRATCLLLALAATAHAGNLDEARSHLAARRYPEARALLLEAANDPATRLEALKRLGEAALRVEDWDEAETRFREALATDPDDAGAIGGLWETRLSRAGFSKAARDGVAAAGHAWLTEDPDDPRRWEAAAVAAYLTDDRARQDRLVEGFAARFPDRAIPGLLEGLSFEAIITERDATRRSARCLAFQARFPESAQRSYVWRIHLSTLLAGSPARLRRTCRRLARVESGNAVALGAIGRVLVHADTDLRFAASCLLESLVLPFREPDRPRGADDEVFRRWREERRAGSRAALGRAFFRRGRTEEAIRQLELAARVLTHDPRGLTWLGEALAEAGRIEEAVDAYDRALEGGADGAVERARAALRPIPTRMFTEVTASHGLRGVRGGRVAFGDFDGDGRDDLFLGNRLFANDGTGRFTDVTAGRGLAGQLGGGRGGLFADVDDDGRLDLFLFRSGSDRLFLQQEDGSFREGTPPAMRAFGEYPAEGAAFGAMDGGRLGLYVANYEKRGRPLSRGSPDALWRSLGGGRWEDATALLRGRSLEPMCGRGVCWADWDEDGDSDIFVGNYRLDPNHLMRRQADGTYLDVARKMPEIEGREVDGYYGHTIGSAWGDLDGDGLLDLVQANLAHPRYIGFSDTTRILMNQGPPDYRFRDTFRESGVRYEETHSDVALADVDLDGDLDLYLTSVYRGRKSFLYLNDGRGHFMSATWRCGVRVDNGWGCAFSDIDGDGDPDLVVGSGSGVRLFRNDRDDTHRWIAIRLEGREGNRSSIGARVVVTCGDLRATRLVSGGKGTGTQDSLEAIVGLGDRAGPVTIEVRWPAGGRARYENVRPGRRYRIVEGDAAPRPVEEGK